MAGEQRAPFRALALRCQGEIQELDLFRRCGCSCIACSREAQHVQEGPQATFGGYQHTAPAFQDPETLGIHHDLPGQIRRWLAGRREAELPAFVAVGLSAEVLLGPGVAQDRLVEAVRLLLEAEIGLILQTRRPVPDPLLDLLGAHRSRVQVAVPLFTPKEEMLKTWEPGTSSNSQRLFNIQRLVTRGVPVVVTIRPLIPYVNDGDEHLERLVVAAAEAGARRFSASFLRLTNRLRERLSARAPTSTRLILSAYEDRGPGIQEERQLPVADLRRRIYQRLARHARAARARFGICQCLDPELGGHPCQLWLEEGANPPQRRAAPPRQNREKRTDRGSKQVGLWSEPDP